MTNNGVDTTRGPTSPPGPVYPILKGRHGALSVLSLTIALISWLLVGYFICRDWMPAGGPFKSGRIFRVESRLEWSPGRVQRQATTPLPLAPALSGRFPGIERAVRISQLFSRTLLTPENGLPISESRGVWADGDLFEMFDIPFAAGERSRALAEPRAVVLSESLAARCFPGGEALGRSIRINGRSDFRVTGIFRDLPESRPVSFRFVLSSDPAAAAESGWNSSTVFTFVRLAAKASPFRIEGEIRDLPRDRGGGENKSLYLKPLGRISRDRDIYFEFDPRPGRLRLGPFAAVALVILLAAWLNLFRGAVSGTSSPKIEAPSAAGSRPAARPNPERRGVLPEYLALFGISLVPAAAGAFLLAPLFGRLTGRVPAPLSPLGWLALGGVTLLMLGLGILKGAAWSGLFRDRRSPERVFFHRSARWLQIIAAAVLALIAIGSFRAVERSPGGVGLDPRGLLTLDLSHLDRDGLAKATALRADLLKHPHVLSAAFSLRLPFETHGTSPVALEGEPGGRGIMARINLVNADFAEAFSLQMTPASREAGRSMGLPEGTWTCLVNQSAAEAFGVSDAAQGAASLVGRQILFSEGNLPVVTGVIRDFPFTRRGEGIEPLILVYRQGGMFTYPRLTLRLYPGDLDNTISFVRSRYEMAFPEDAPNGRLFEQVGREVRRSGSARAGLFALGAGAVLLLALLGVGASPGPGSFREDREARGSAIRRLFVPEALVWMGIFLYSLLVIRPSRLYFGFGKMTRMPLFGTERPFVEGSIWEPGGVVNALAGFFGQLLYRDWIGALIITALAGILAWLTARMFSAASGRSIGPLALIPALLLLIYLGRYENPLALVLGTAAAGMAFLTYATLPGRRAIPRLVGFLGLFIGVHIVAGGAAYLFLISAAGFEFLKKARRIPAAIGCVFAAVWPFLYGRLFFDLPRLDLYARHLPFHTDYAMTSWLWVPWALVCVLPAAALAGCLVPRTARKILPGGPSEAATKPRIRRRIVSAAAILVFSLVGLGLSRDPGRDLLHEVIHASRARDWEGVVRQARRLPSGSYNLYVNYQVNRALCHLGRMGDEMFSFVQQMDALALIPFETERFVMRDAAVIDTALDLGALNIAEHLSLELMEVVGVSPLILRDLALIHLAKRQPETARVFIQAMSRDPVFHAQAARWLKGEFGTLTSRRIEALRAKNLQVDFANIKLERLLAALLERNPYNRMAFEYLMALYLMERRLDKLIENLDRLNALGYGRIPRHYEEAILLYMLDTGEGVDLKGLRVSDESISSYREFTRLMGGSKPGAGSPASPEMRGRFGRSYYFYYSFNRSGVSE